MSQQGPFGRRIDAPPGREPGPGPGPGFPPAPRFTWLLGVVCVLGLAYVVSTTVRSDAPGAGGVAVGRPLPPFAAPLASSTRRCDDELCDANVSLDADEDVRRAACDVRLPDVLNVCALADRGPVALAFVAGRSERCQDQVDVMERLRPRFPAVQFAAVFVRGERAALREAVRERGWTLPVGHDGSGAVSDVYAVAACPTITFARRGGRIESTSLAFLGERALAARLRAVGG